MDRRYADELPLSEPRKSAQPISATEESTPEIGRSSTARQVLKVAFFVVVIVGTVYYLWSQRDDMVEAVRRLSLGTFLFSGVFALVGTALWGQVWISLLHGMGVHPPQRDANSVFFVSQIGKYLPGKLWPALMQMQAGRRWGASRRLTLGSNILFLGIVVASGIAVGAVLLPWASSGGLSRYWWLLLLLIPLAAGLHPRVVPSVLDWLFARFGREPLGLHLTGRGLFSAVAWAVVTWVVFGLHLLVMMQSYGDFGLLPFAAATGGMALAWAGGIASLIAPAGVGVRDTLVVVTLSPITGSANALTITLASRVLLILSDAILAGAGALLARRRREVSA